MKYSQEQFNAAILSTNEEYNEMSETSETIFEGQTRVNKDRQYKMYWTINNQLYYTINNL